MKRMVFLISGLLVFAVCLAGEPPAGKETAPEGKPLNEPERVIRRNDLVRITLIFPGRKIGSLEKVQRNGEVATPEGSFVKAADLSIASFRTNLFARYKKVPGYEEVQLEISIASSPYSVIRLDSTKTSPSEKSGPPAPPVICPRNFKSPLTVWQAIQREGGIPTGVDSRRIRILKANLARKTLDCGGKDGVPDGNTPVESGDYLFLVPGDVPVSKIFE